MHVPPIARAQAGAFTRRQAIAAGIGRDSVRRRIESGRWRVLIEDVLVARDALVTPSTRAWAAHLATGGVISHHTAGALHGLIDQSGALHVSSRVNLHVRVPSVIEHRVRLDAADTTRHDGLPLTTRLRTVVDLLGCLPVDEARTFLFRAVQQRWIDDAVLHAQIARRRGMSGNTQLRELVGLLGTGAHSAAELLLHRILATIPGAQFRANVPLWIGGSRFVVDVLISSHQLVLEVDGRRFHSGVEQFTNDRRRQNALVGAGYTILRFTWIDLVERPDEVRSAVLSAISVPSAAKTARTGP